LERSNHEYHDELNTCGFPLEDRLEGDAAEEGEFLDVLKVPLAL
jgi:hypothetical protein